MDAELFTSGELRQFLQKRSDAAVAAVQKVPGEELRFAPDAVVDRLVDQFEVKPVVLDWAGISRTEPQETEIVRHG